MYKGVLTNPAGNYAEYNPGPSWPPAADRIVWTDVTAATSPITTQLAAFGGPAAQAYATGLFPPIAFQSVIGGYAYYGTSNGQDEACLILGPRPYQSVDPGLYILGHLSAALVWLPFHSHRTG